MSDTDEPRHLHHSLPDMHMTRFTDQKRGAAWMWWLSILAVLCIGAWSFWKFARHDDAPQYQTTPVKRMDITSKVTATGTLSAVVSVVVGSQISGNIKELLADFNTPVKQGQVVAKLDPASFEANVHQSEGDLATAQAGVELAQVTAKRTAELFANRLVASAENDKAIADLHQAQAAVQVRQAMLERTKIDLARCTIYAPVDGVVISRNVDVGQTVAAAMTAPVLFTIAGDLSKMHIEANVSEADIGGVREGQVASFLVDAFPDQTFHGKIVQVRYAPITVDNVVTYVTVIEVDNPKHELRPGMTANVSIVIAEKKDVLAVPNSALRFKPPQDSAAPAETRKTAGTSSTGPPDGARPKKPAAPIATRKVYRLVGDTPKAIEVTTGVGDGINTEIISGLKDDEKVITSVISAKPLVAPSAFGSGPPGGSSRRM